MRLLLTGATGFVGRNILLREMVENRYEEVWVAIRDKKKLNEQFVADGFSGIPSKIKVVECDAFDWKLADAPVFDHVVHSAGVLFARDRDSYFKVNVEGTLSLLRQLKSPGRIVVLSSQAASGPCQAQEVEKREGGEDLPVTWYGQSKLQMEKGLQKEFSHLDYLVLRPPMILGPRDTASLPIFKMVRRGLYFKAGIKPKTYSFISVFDLVGAVFSVLEDTSDWKALDRRYFFVASSHPTTDREILNLAARASEKKGICFGLPQSIVRGVSFVVDSIPPWRRRIPSLSSDRAKDLWPDRWVVSPEAFQKRFRWNAREDLLRTLQQTRDWYLKTGQLS